ncbi:MAG TPA: 50S ribosomal protein L6 [Candidatus Omnitrophota bacterium]|nr:50S ribosomal protein L6 [Candidatus Omnitrophota bacterium]
MSRIGKKPIDIPDKVKASVDGSILTIEGPKGKLEHRAPLGIKIEVKDKSISVSRSSDTKIQKALHGVTRTLIVNMIKGCVEGYLKELDVVGVGFRAQVQGNTLNMQLGFTHPVNFPFPQDIKISTPNPNRIRIEGIDKVKVGEIAAEIRRIFPPEPYKGKGIRYVGEFVRRKQGKAVTK